MKEEHKKLYSRDEVKLLGELDALFEEWRKTVGDKEDSWFIPDGFYPKYLVQKPKILFMGRDAYDLFGEEDASGDATYIEKFLPQYLTGRIGPNGKNINGVKFHKMLIQVAYGILHECNWNQSAEAPGKPSVPYAFDICDGGRIFEQVSFAFMNLCKWSHDSWKESSPGTNAAWNDIDLFVEKSTTGGRNFIMDEIAMLAPDIIISMNFGLDRITTLSGGAAKLVDSSNPDCYVYQLETQQGTTVLFDSWHFSGRKSEEFRIYNPLCEQIDAYWRKGGR